MGDSHCPVRVSIIGLGEIVCLRDIFKDREIFGSKLEMEVKEV